jgi:transposase InsO family protein
VRLGRRAEEADTVLVELGLVEQRYRAVLEVLDDGATVVDVARRYGVARQTVHAWLRRYAAGGLGGLADQSSKPASCPHQIPPPVEARVVALRRAHPGWGPRRILAQLRSDGVVPLPGRSSVYRALVRHGLIQPQQRRRRRQDYQRWERARPMELWQMDVMGGVRLLDGTRLSVVTGLDDHSRYCVCARLVERATARPVCDALAAALARHGAPEAILTDNGKVFTARFGPGPGPVLFDRICHEHGIKHLLTAPYSPTTTGKVERLHKTLRVELFGRRAFASLGEAQAALDAWVEHYNTVRPHQGVGDRPPADRFALAQPVQTEPALAATTAQDGSPPERRPQPPPQPVGLPVIQRRVAVSGRISLAGVRYLAGRWLAGELVQVALHHGLVEISHRGVLVATHASHHRPGSQPAIRRAPAARPPRPASTGVTVTRIADPGGTVSFAGAGYYAGWAYRGQQVQVALVGDTVQLAVGGRVIKVHPIRHDRAKEHGAFATPNGRPRHRGPSVA